MGVATGDGRTFEARGRYSGTLDSSLAESAGDALLAAVVPMTVAVAALVALLAWRGNPTARAALFAIVAGTVLTQSTKFALGRFDPTGAEALRHTSGAFPSGHSTLAASAGLATLIVAPRARPLLTYAVITSVGLVNATLMLREWHYPSDIAAGALIAAIAAAIVQPPARGRWIWPVAAGVAAITALTAGVVATRAGIVGRPVTLTALAVAVVVTLSLVGWGTPRRSSVRHPARSPATP